MFTLDCRFQSVAVIHGGSRSSHVIILLGMYCDKILLMHLDVNNCVMSSTSSPAKIAGQSIFFKADLILSF